MPTLSIRGDDREPYYRDGALQPVTVGDEQTSSSPGNRMKGSDEDCHSRGYTSEAEPDPAKNLRIPQKGYRVHLAVSPNPYGGKHNG